jgi:hypothetical protein
MSRLIEQMRRMPMRRWRLSSSGGPEFVAASVPTDCRTIIVMIV